MFLKSSVCGTQNILCKLGKERRREWGETGKHNYRGFFVIQIPISQKREILSGCLIYQSFVFGKEIIDGHLPTVIIVTLLCSIIQVHLKSNKDNLKAVELTLQDDVLKNASDGKGEVVTHQQ